MESFRHRTYKDMFVVADSEETRVNKRKAQFDTNEIRNYQTNPEMSRWFINFFSKRGDLVMDNFAVAEAT